MFFSFVSNLFAKPEQNQDILKLYLQYVKIPTTEQILAMYKDPEQMPLESKIKIVLVKRKLGKKLTDETVIRSIKYSIIRIEQFSELIDFSEKFLRVWDDSQRADLALYPPGKILKLLASFHCTPIKHANELLIVFPTNSKMKHFFPEETNLLKIS